MMTASYGIICLPTKHVSYFNIFATVLGTVVLVITTIWLPIAAPELNSAKAIFTDVRPLFSTVRRSSPQTSFNGTGWPSGWAFCMTFLSATWTLSGYDVAAHVAEETSNAARTVPRAMIWSTWSSALLGACSNPDAARLLTLAAGFLYLISLALCATDVESLVGDDVDQPLGALFAAVLGQRAGVALLAINFICQFACGVAFVRPRVPSASPPR